MDAEYHSVENKYHWTPDQGADYSRKGLIFFILVAIPFYFLKVSMLLCNKISTLDEPYRFIFSFLCAITVMFMTLGFLKFPDIVSRAHFPRTEFPIALHLWMFMSVLLPVAFLVMIMISFSNFQILLDYVLDISVLDIYQHPNGKWYSFVDALWNTSCAVSGTIAWDLRISNYTFLSILAKTDTAHVYLWYLDTLPHQGTTAGFPNFGSVMPLSESNTDQKEFIHRLVNQSLVKCPQYTILETHPPAFLNSTEPERPHDMLSLWIAWYAISFLYAFLGTRMLTELYPFF